MGNLVIFHSFLNLLICLCIWISFHWLWKPTADWTKCMALSFLSCDWLSEMKEGSSFPPHENNPVFQDKANSCVQCLREKPQVMSSTRRTRLCTEYYRKAKTISLNTRSCSLSKSVCLSRDRLSTTTMFALEQAFVTADFFVIYARQPLFFCFVLQREINCGENATLETRRRRKKIVDWISRRLRKNLTCV